MNHMGRELTAEQRLQKAVVAITANKRYVALAGVLMIGERVVVEDYPTACTDGKNEWYGRAFVDSLSDAELRFLMLHESYHKMYRHLITWDHLFEIHAKIAGAACDYVINLQLVDDNASDPNFAKMPKMGLVDTKYRGWDAAKVFWEIYNNAEKKEGKPNYEGGGFDDHDWEGAKEMSAEDTKALAREVDRAIRQGALLAGKVGDGTDSLDLESLLAPQIDWREVLRDFVTTTCSGNDYSTWRRPNRRFISAGIYMPSGISEQVEELVLAIDTSGSIGQRDLTLFLSEVQAICDTVHPRLVRVLYWGCSVVGDEAYMLDELDSLTSSTKPIGGGGTMVECVPEYMQAKGINPQAVIVLTDGYLGGSWGSWNSPVLWCILDNARTTADNGTTVHINSGTM